MGYEVKVADIRNVRKATSKQIEGWLGKLSMAGEACNAMTTAPGMQGATAESIKKYITEVHLSLLVSVAQMLEEYKDRLYVYEVGYESIDGAAKAHITQDSLEDQYSKLGREEEEFLEIAEQLQAALEEVSDILSASAPSTGMVANSFERLKRKTRLLNDTVGTYEEGHRNDCEGVKEQSSSIRAMIVSLSKNSEITISTYRAGAILENPAFANLQKAYTKSTNYYQGNGEKIKAARDYIDTKEALAEARVEKGAWDVAAAVGLIVIGAAAIVVTGGAATPLVAIAIGSTIAYGASNGVEAIQDIQYGLAGDVYSVAGNPIRDTVFLGNQTAYDTWGTISAGISLGFCVSGAGASAGKVTLAGAKQGIQTFLGSGASNIAKSTVSFGAKTLLIGGSGVAVEKVVTPYTSEDFGRLSGLLAGAYVGSKVMGTKAPKINEADRIKIDSWKYTPDDELYLKYRDVYDNPRYYDQTTGEIHWPVDDGFKVGTKKNSIINENKIFKRYGDDSGQFLGNATDSFESRALAPHSEGASINYYQLTENYEMTTGEAASWFGSDGGAEQFVKYKSDGTKYTIKELVDQGILEDITDLVESGGLNID